MATRERYVLRGAAAICALLLGTGLLEPVGGAVSPAVAAPSNTLSGTRPNIVLVVTDDQTLDSMPFMPYVQEQRAAGKYVYFTQAETNNPLCCPGRASLLTGQVDTRTGVQNNSQAGNIRPAETLAVPLHAAGYRTGLFGKLLNGYNDSSGIWPGWDDFQPIDSYNIYAQYNYDFLNNGVKEHHGDTPADYQVDVMAKKSLDFIDRTPTNQPLFMYVAPTATHTPFVAAPRYQDAYASTPIPLPDNWAEADVSDKPAWIQQLPLPGRGGAVSQRRKQYAAGLGVDDMLRSIDERLAATGRLDNTVVMFISDNGLSAGSNRWPSKICELRGCGSIPFLVRYPGQAGRTDTRLVTNTDIAPTIVDLAGTTLPKAPDGRSPDGRSLVPMLEDPTGTAATHPAILEHWPGGDQNGSFDTGNTGTPGFYAIRTERWRYAEVTNLAVAGNTEYELYDEVADPGELMNRAADPAYAQTRADLKNQLDVLIKDTGAQPGKPQGSWRPGNLPPPAPAEAQFLLRNSNTPGPPDLSYSYGLPGDVPLACDWNGNGVDTAGLFRDGTFLLRNTNSAGRPNKTFNFGQAGDIPLCGDWNGTGVDSIGVFRAGTFYLRNSNTAGPPTLTVSYGAPTDIPVTGDWNGDGIDSIGVYRSGRWLLSDRNKAPRTAYSFGFGGPGDQPLVGDWNGTGADRVAVRSGDTFLLRYVLAAGTPDVSVLFGTVSDRGLAGDWDGVGGASIGVARGFSSVPPPDAG